MRNKKLLQTRRYVDPVMPIVFRYRFLIMLCVLLVAAGAFCGSVSAYDDIQTAQNLSDALNSTTDSGVGAAYVDSVGNVVLNTNVNLNFTINITEATNPSPITLTTESADKTIFRNVSGVPLFNVNSGTFILKGNESYNSNITLDGNKSTYTSSSGGYSLVKVNGGIFNMSTGSVLQNSNFTGNGGAVYVNASTFNMNSGTISGNNATSNGGGVYVYEGTFTMDGGNISNNTADNGGGVYVDGGTFNMNGGTISNNTASGTSSLGGGVYVCWWGIFNMTGGTISDNTASGTSSLGGGVYVCWWGIFNMTGGTISDNTAMNGGGVYVTNSGTFINMSDGTISNNTADNGNGGGVYVYWLGIFNMNGGTISNNTADNGNGGGVYVYWLGIFNMNGGNISGNNAQHGGGVCLYASTFNMDGGTISGNNAEWGGGAEVNSGIFNMDGGTISGNNAEWGGGVLVNTDGTFNLNGSATVNADNDVYLTSGKFITVTGDLDISAGALNITPAASFIAGNTVVKYDSVISLDNWSFNFALNTTWIQENQMDLTQSGTNLTLNNNFTVKYYLTDSNMTPYITNTSVPYDAHLTPPAAPTRTGYTFNSWNQGSSSGIPWNFTTDTVKANTYLYACWTANTYNITYLNNSGSGTIANQTATYNASVTLNDGSNFSRTGYTLARWMTASDGSGTSYALGGTVSPYLVTDNLTLYAIWTANPTSSNGDGGNDGNNADYGPVSLNGTFTTEDGNLILYYPAGSNIMVTVFKDYFNGATAPSGVLYLNVYDVHSTANSGTSVTLVFNIAASELERMNLTSNDIAILHYYDGEWHQMTITSIELVDGVYQFTVTSTHTSPFMVAYNVDGTWVKLEGANTPTSTLTTGSTEIVPTSTTTPTPTETTSSPVPLVGIIAGLGAAALLLRRR